MGELCCYICGASVKREADGEWVKCEQCGQPLKVAISRRWRAATDMLTTLRDPDLDDGLRRQLQSIVMQHREDLSREGLAATHGKQEPLPTPEVEEIEPETEPRPTVVSLPGPGPRRGPPERPAEPSIWSRLGPLFAENLLFALGGFLLLAGAVYLVTTAWTSMSGLQRLLVIAGSLELFGGMLYGAARMVHGRKGLGNTERVLLFVTVALLPLAMVAAGQVARLSLPWAALVGAVLAASGWFPLRSLVRTEDVRLYPFHPAAYLAFTAAILFAPQLTGHGILAITALSALVILACEQLRRRLIDPPTGASAWVAGALLAFAAAVFAGDLAVNAAGVLPPLSALAPVGILLAALGVGAVILEPAARSGAVARSPVLVSAFALAVTGVAAATGDERCLMLSAWLATATALILSLRFDRATLLLPALGLSVVAYLLLPAPIRALALGLRDSAASSLGYEATPLPLSFYGITFAPYLALVALLTGLLLKAGKAAHARVSEVWLLVIAIGLAAMSLLLGSDLRAPTAVLAADGVILIAAGALLRRERPILFGTLGVFGGAICGLVHLDPPPGLGILCAAALGLLGLGIAHALARGQDPDAFRHRCARDVVLAVCVLSLGLVFRIGLPLVEDRVAGGFDPAGYGACAVLLMLLAAALRQPLAALLAVPALVRGIISTLLLLGEPMDGPWTPLALSAGMLLWLGAWKGLERVFPWRESEADDPPPNVFGAILGLGAIAVQIAGLWSIQNTWESGAWQVALGVFTGTAVLLLIGTLTSGVWMIWFAAFQLAFAGILATAASGFAPGHVAGAVGVALAAWLMTLTPRLVGQRTQVALLAHTATGAGLALGGLAALWLLGARLAAIPGTVTTEQAWSMLSGSLLLVGLGAQHRRHNTGAALAGLVLVLVPIAFLDLLGARGSFYPFAFLATGGLVCFLGRRQLEERESPASNAVLGLVLLQGTAALITAVAVGHASTLDSWLQLAALTGTAGLIWPLLRLAPSGAMSYVTSLLFLSGITLAVCLSVADGLLGMDWRYQGALLLVLTGAFVLMARRQLLPTSTAAGLTLATPVLAATAAGYTALAAWITFGFAFGPDAIDEAITPVLDITALAMIASAIMLGNAWKRGALFLLATSLVLAAYATAPINALLEGSREEFWFPDLECALVGVLIAAIALLRATRTRGATRELWLMAGAGSAYVPTALGLLLTAADVRHVTTPLTFIAAAVVPLLVLRRKLTGPHMALHGLGILAAFWTLSIYLVPDTDAPPPEILPLLGFEAAVLGWLLPYWGRFVRGATPLELANRQMSGVGTFCLILTLLCVGANAAALGLPERTSADGRLLALGIVACTLAAIRTWRLSADPDRPRFVQLSLLSAITLYSFIALRSPWLSLLDGHHADALIVLSATLFLTAGKGDTPRKVELLLAAGFLPVLGLLGSYLPGATGRTVTLFLISAAYGIGTLTTRRAHLGVVAVLFLNLGLFSLWLNRGIYDPSFYGVPAGLSILLVTELAQRRLRAPQTGALRLIGLATLYGSVAFQVLRVDAPWHALALFALGLATVIIGFLRRHNALVLAGTVAVILDVIVYLARHGLEQDFIGSLLLISSGVTVLTVAAMTARQRARKPG